MTIYIYNIYIYISCFNYGGILPLSHNMASVHCCTTTWLGFNICGFHVWKLVQWQTLNMCKMVNRRVYWHHTWCGLFCCYLTLLLYLTKRSVLLKTYKVAERTPAHTHTSSFWNETKRLEIFMPHPIAISLPPYSHCLPLVATTLWPCFIDVLLTCTCETFRSHGHHSHAYFEPPILRCPWI